MASSCRSKVELHLFSYVGAVIQKLPQHLSLPQPGAHRAAAFSERLAIRGGRQGRHRNRNRGKKERKVGGEINVKLGLPFHLVLGEGREEVKRRWWIAGRMRSGGTGGHLRSIKNQ